MGGRELKVPLPAATVRIAPLSSTSLRLTLSTIPVRSRRLLALGVGITSPKRPSTLLSLCPHLLSPPPPTPFRSVCRPRTSRPPSGMQKPPVSERSHSAPSAGSGYDNTEELDNADLQMRELNQREVAARSSSGGCSCTIS